MVVLITLVSLLVISNLVTMFFLFIKENPQEIQEEVVLDNFDNEVAIDEDSNVVFDDDSTYVSNSKGDLQVDWREFPATENFYNIMSYDFTQKQEIIDLQMTIYNVGTIKSEPYIGRGLFVASVSPDGMALRDDKYWIIFDGEKTIVLGKYSDKTEWPILQELFVYNDNLTLAGREMPDSLAIPNSDYKLIKSEMRFPKLITDYYNLEKVYSINGITVYGDERSGCFVVRRPDSSVEEYHINYPFLEGDRNSTNPSVFSQVLDFTWLKDGLKNDIEFQTTVVSGCGTAGCYDYVRDNDFTQTQLVAVGQMPDESSVYYYNDEVIENIDNNPKSNSENILLKTYGNYYPGWDSETEQPIKKEAFKDFVKKYPVLFWQDAFGKWMQFTNIKYQPSVECGKPVIYLYPEEDMNVDVKVEPTGGIKFSDPAYNGGWSVFASTESELLNLNDRITYPYLFWEGYGYKYSQPKQGFVVKSSDVEVYLKNILAKLGLTKKETADFNEFWVPEMLKQEKPFYFITFLPQSEFDKIAPLKVNPAPDTVIRVFMDYQGLDQFKSVEPLRITTPKRQGFTVVEWGGALH